MKIRKIFNWRFYIFNYKEYKSRIQKDIRFNASFRNSGSILSWRERQAIEFKTVVAYRKFQVNSSNIWGYYYKWKLSRMTKKTGIEFLGNTNIGDGLLIGHWGRIIINGNAKFGNEIMLTHGVTIGRDIRGKREGVPTFGNKICIRANSTVVGNIKIGDDVLIAPNTFVNFDVPSHSVVIGNPASIHSKNNATLGHTVRI